MNKKSFKGVTVLSAKDKTAWSLAAEKAKGQEAAKSGSPLPSITYNQWMAALAKASRAESGVEDTVPPGFVSRVQLAEIFSCGHKTLTDRIRLLKKHNLIETVVVKKFDSTGYAGRLIAYKYYKVKSSE